jgi:hypothetical protein
MLQKVPEFMEYRDIMEKAMVTDDPIVRVALANAFYFATQGITENRMCKPFNPILGETFEVVNKDYRIIAE